MPDANKAAFEFLLNRRSRPAKTLALPVPDRAALLPILTAAARSPDHGKLEPWRFIVLERAALVRLGDLAGERTKAVRMDLDKATKLISQFADAHLAVIVVSSPVASEKVPKIEQVYSAGAVCLALLNGALASGWGANWLSGWALHDRDFITGGLGLAAHENVAGFIAIGSETCAPPERPRPDLERITQWMAT